jgi:hypothetical protein
MSYERGSESANACAMHPLEKWGERADCGHTFGSWSRDLEICVTLLVTLPCVQN